MDGRQVVKKPKAAENGYRKSEDTPTGIQRPLCKAKWEWNLETDEYSWSEEMYQVFNLTPQPSSPRIRTFLNFIHPDDKQRVVKALGKALVGSEPYNISHRILRVDGSVCLVHGEAKVWFDRSGRPIRIMGTLRNVNNLRQGEEAPRNEPKTQTSV